MTRQAAMRCAHSNQLVGYQGWYKNKLGMTMFPNGGTAASPGNISSPRCCSAIYARTRADPKPPRSSSTSIVTNRKPARSSASSAAFRPRRRCARRSQPTLDELEQAMASTISLRQRQGLGPLPPPPPKGAGEIETRAAPASTSRSASARSAVADGAKQFLRRRIAVPRARPDDGRSPSHVRQRRHSRRRQRVTQGAAAAPDATAPAISSCCPG